MRSLEVSLLACLTTLPTKQYELFCTRKKAEKQLDEQQPLTQIMHKTFCAATGFADDSAGKERAFFR